MASAALNSHKIDVGSCFFFFLLLILFFFNIHKRFFCFLRRSVFFFFFICQPALKSKIFALGSLLVLILWDKKFRQKKSNESGMKLNYDYDKIRVIHLLSMRHDLILWNLLGRTFRCYLLESIWWVIQLLSSDTYKQQNFVQWKCFEIFSNMFLKELIPQDYYCIQCLLFDHFVA